MGSPVSNRIRGTSLSRRLALVAVFSAIYAVFRYIPTFPMYGLAGTSFKAGDFLAPLLGIILGPWLAIPCIIIGTVINYAVTPPFFLGLDFLPACTAATVAGLITTGKTKSAITLYAILLGVFLVLPLSTFWINVPGGYQAPYTWLHIAAFIALISPLGLTAYKWMKESTGLALVVAVLVTILSATMAQHLTGGILEEAILFPTFKITTAAKAYAFWSFLFYIYPIERFVITAVGTLFGVSVIRAFRTTGLRETLARIHKSSNPVPSLHQAFKAHVTEN